MRVPRCRRRRWSSSLRLRLLTTSVLAVAALFAPTRAGAVGTRTFDLDTLEKLSGGDLTGVSISSDGIVRAGWTLGNVALGDATAAFASLAMDDDSVLVGTSPGGKVYRVAGDQATVFAETKELAVTSLARGAGGAIYAATIPGGKIFKIAQGKADLYATLPDTDHVWALAADKAGTALYAATGGTEGTGGKVFRVTAGGQSSVHFKSDEPHLVSIAVADNGDVYAGSSGKGLLYKVTGPGRASVLYDMPGEEVKAVAIGPKGIVYAVGNEYVGELPEARKGGSSGGRAPPGPATGTRMKPGKGSLVRIDPAGRPERMMHHDEFHYLSLALDPNGTPYVGTGAEGRVYSVDDAHVVTLVADTDSRQIGALGFTRGDAKTAKPFAVASDPTVFHRVVAQGGADSVWTSKVLDAGLRARFGHLSWRGTPGLELSTRTGNTATVDPTWSGWSNAMTAAAPVTSPPGRFVQVRARWPKKDAILTEVVLPFQTDNVRAIVTEVTAHQKGATRDTKEGVVASGSETPKHDSVVHIAWKTDNPDSDALRYRVWYRKDDQTTWRDALRSDEVLTKTELDWDTAALPEGKYRIRVEASDELANPPDQTQKHALESALVLVDNTPPVFQGLTVAGRKLKGRVVDGLGPIVRVEMAVDGRLEWRPLAAADGIFDTADEAIDADVSALVPPGSHIVAVRAFDAAGNAAVQEVEAK